MGNSTPIGGAKLPRPDHDEASLEERYDQLCAERDELEHQLHNLARSALIRNRDPLTCAADDCSLPVETEISPNIPLCTLHLWSAAHQLLDHYATRPIPDDAPATGRIRDYLSERKRNPASAVYYLAMNGRIKIGSTTDLRQRMQSFYSQPEDLLAVEPGDRDRELQRHRQFAQARHGKTELFDRTRELERHIRSVVAMFGDPQQFIQGR